MDCFIPGISNWKTFLVMDIQNVIIGIIMITCVAFVGIRIYKLLSGNGKTACDSCAGCALKKTCDKKHEKQ